jgi:hypothetical protein
MMTIDSPVLNRTNRRIDGSPERRSTVDGPATGTRHLPLVAVLLALAGCVDLTLPPELRNYNAGGAGGSVVGLGGSVGAGGNTGTTTAPGTGGIVVPASTGGVPAGSGGMGIDAPGAGGAGGASPDAPPGTGGVDAAGGAVGAGGTEADLAPPPVDVQPGTGGIAVGTGGTSAGTGGTGTTTVTGSGGVIGSGGVTTSTGGTTTASGGTVGSGGKTGSGGTTTATGGTVSASGGTTSAGGTTTSTGGSTGYNCSSPISPVSGYVTNFTDWNATTARWGTGTLIGTIYGYASTNPAATMTAKVEGTTPGLHMVGSTSSTGYAGGGLTFLSCVTTASFTKVSFDVYGSAGSCAIELQLQTFDQRPSDQTPPGSCNPSGTCYNFPKRSSAVSLSTAVSAPGTTVTTTLSTMTNWSTAEGAQIVGIQWQFTGTCSIDATFTNIKFQ